MRASIIKSKKTANNTFINTIAFSGIEKDEVLGTEVVRKDWFYFESVEEISENTDLPKFNPDDYNIRVSEFTTEDEETGEVTVRQSKWLDGRE